MTAADFAREVGWKLLCGAEGEDRPVEGCYVGDLLSWVMARAKDGDIWITVMGNINAIAVAALTDSACIVLAEGASLDEDASQRAQQQGIAVYSSEKTAYQIATEVYEILKR